MKTLEREEGMKFWETWWGAMREEFFKAEVLQSYMGETPNPSLPLWLAGKKDESINVLRKEGLESNWTEPLKGKESVKKIRLHVVEKPLSPYLEWEIEHYKMYNIPFGGEEVYLVSKEKIADLKLPKGDFCVFDNRRVVENTYDETGKLIRFDFYDEKDDISSFLDLKSELWKHREPLP